MAEFPALQLWTDAYLGDTTHLTTIEHGAYLLLLMTAWRTKETRLPDDDKLLARYVRCSAGQWKRLRPVLQPFFRVENGFWVQGRLTDEAVAVKQRKEKAATAGRASALKRKGRHATGVGSELQPNGNGASTRDQHYHSHSQEEDPVDKESTGVSAVLPDPEKVMFDRGVQLLAGAGKSEAQARPLLGKWKRDHGAEAVIVALGKAQREGAIDPISFIEGCFRADKSPWGELSVPC